MYYASFGILSLIIHFIINFEVLWKPRKGKEDELHKRYRWFLWSIMVYYVADIFWGTLYGFRIIPLAYADTVLFFASMVLSLLFWTRYIVVYLNQNNFLSKVLACAGWSILIFEFATLIVNFFVPIVFYFDENKEYVPEDARYITLAVQVVLFALTAVYTLVITTRLTGKDKLHHLAIGISGIVMTVFIVLQTLYPLLPLYAIGCLIATCIIHTFVEADERADRYRELGSIKQMAYKDPLTHVKNKTAFLEVKEDYEHLIKKELIDEFGIIVLDLNDLKLVNDSLGHDAGDRFIQNSCKMICEKFKRSPVFRIGGDEFVVLLQGEDYRERNELLYSFNKKIEENLKTGDVVIACGMSELNPGKDAEFDAIFDRADQKMYERKKKLKEMALNHDRNSKE